VNILHAFRLSQKSRKRAPAFDAPKDKVLPTKVGNLKTLVQLSMEARSLRFVCDSCSGKLLTGSPATLVRGVCTDSRRIQPDDLFFALKGDRFDGHDFVQQVAQKGAAAVVVDSLKVPAEDLGCAIIAVDETRQALGRLGACYRADFQLPIVAVGGSNGKTTTKELLASVLRQKFCTLWSEDSFNNDIGVPLTLLRLERSHKAAVLEVGTNHPGELAPLVQLIQPQFGVLTNVAREHLEFFGDLAGVAQEEGWLAELLPSTGALFLNGDNDWTPGIVKRTRARVVKVGFGPKNDWQAERVRLDGTGIAFEVRALQSKFSGEYRMNLWGRHQALNALFALAVGAELGVSPEEARGGLANCEPPKMRLQVWEANGVTVLDDSYNANADSMLAALQTLHDFPCAGRRIAVLGDMAELGEHSAEAHHEIGERAAELGVGHLIAVGKWAGHTGQAARAAGLQNITECDDVLRAGTAIKELVKPGDVVLLKASRAAGFESIGDVMRGSEKTGTP
jgi:UDP-N-acetylmuramoyl-tripeptide--D-alanyl-D-alanine ligase